MRGISSTAGRVPRNRLHTAIDIETWGLDAREDGSSFALGAAFDERGAFRFATRNEMVEWIGSKDNRGRVLWAHNGGRYDYVSLFGNYVASHARDLTRVNGRLIELRLRSGNNVTRLRDSYNLYPRPLAALGEALGYPKGDTPEKFKNPSRDKDGKVTETVTNEDHEYCLRDCEILYRSIMALHAEFGEVRATLPSMALAVFRRRYVDRPYFVPTRLQPLDLGFRNAYYGGRVEAYYVGALPQPPYYYDINSLYPQAMVEARFPDPSDLHTLLTPEYSITEETWQEHLRDHEGYAVGTAYVEDDMDPPPLPWRNAEKKLLFPTGQFDGAWTFVELRNALSLGADSFLAQSFALSPSMVILSKPMLPRHLRQKANLRRGHARGLQAPSQWAIRQVRRISPHPKRVCPYIRRAFRRIT